MFINNNISEIGRLEYVRPRFLNETSRENFDTRDRNYTSPDEYQMTENYLTYRNTRLAEREEYLIQLA